MLGRAIGGVMMVFGLFQMLAFAAGPLLADMKGVGITFAFTGGLEVILAVTARWLPGYSTFFARPVAG